MNNSIPDIPKLPDLPELPSISNNEQSTGCLCLSGVVDLGTISCQTQKVLPTKEYPEFLGHYDVTRWNTSGFFTLKRKEWSDVGYLYRYFNPSTKLYVYYLECSDLRFLVDRVLYESNKIIKCYTIE